MVSPLAEPELAISLRADVHAPRAARHYVASVDRPSPDLRDAVVLLTSELVARAAMLARSNPAELIELRVWMPSDVVRVELRGRRELLCESPYPSAQQYDVMLVDRLSDRWSIDVDEEGRACIWFEIDRHRPQGEPGAGEPAQEQAPARSSPLPAGARG
jgi:hypothetical protein